MAVDAFVCPPVVNTDEVRPTTPPPRVDPLNVTTPPPPPILPVPEEKPGLPSVAFAVAVAATPPPRFLEEDPLPLRDPKSRLLRRLEPCVDVSWCHCSMSSGVRGPPMAALSSSSSSSFPPPPNPPPPPPPMGGPSPPTSPPSPPPPPPPKGLNGPARLLLLSLPGGWPLDGTTPALPPLRPLPLPLPLRPLRPLPSKGLNGPARLPLALPPTGVTSWMSSLAISSSSSSSSSEKGFNPLEANGFDDTGGGEARRRLLLLLLLLPPPPPPIWAVSCPASRTATAESKGLLLLLLLLMLLLLLLLLPADPELRSTPPLPLPPLLRPLFDLRAAAMAVPVPPPPPPSFPPLPSVLRDIDERDGEWMNDRPIAFLMFRGAIWWDKEASLPLHTMYL